MYLTYLLVLLLLILLNAFFVLAELGAVKARPTMMETLAARGNRRAKLVERIQANIGEYLSVCQVGITFASIGLGFVGEPTIADLLEPGIRRLGLDGAAAGVTSHAVAIAVAYLLVSFLHIILGELVPKSIAIRDTERIALLTSYPMTVFRYVFYVPIFLLNGTVNVILRLFRLPPATKAGIQTEDEIRVILGHSQTSGALSFRQLLHIENVLDMGALTVRNAMRVRRLTRHLELGMTRAEVDAVIAENRFSRYPVLGADPEKPLGHIRVKDLFLAEHAGKPTDDLGQFIRPCLAAREEDRLDQLLSEMQRKACHMTLVFSRDSRWTGIITLEDALEEVVGTIEEEYPLEQPVRLSDLLTVDRTLLDVQGDSILSAARATLHRLKSEQLPLSREAIMLSVTEREKLASSYIGKGLAIPHARLHRLTSPMVIVARMKNPFKSPIAGEDISLLFLLLTPADTPRIHQILLSHIAGIFESEFLEDKLESAASAQELYNAIVTAEQVVLG